jgi:hypothetical protein
MKTTTKKKASAKKTVAKKVQARKKVLEPSGFPPPTDIVIVFYLNISGYTQLEASNAIVRVRDEMRNVLGFAAHLLVLPVYNTDTRIECINPVLLEAKEFSRVKEVIDRAEEAVDVLLVSTAMNAIRDPQKKTDVN